MSAPDFVRESEQRVAARLAEIDAARTEANRVERLHDAAPALLAALQTLHRICRDCDLEHDAERPTEEQYNEAMDAAEVAIAKATGSAA